MENDYKQAKADAKERVASFFPNMPLGKQGPSMSRKWGFTKE